LNCDGPEDVGPLLRGHAESENVIAGGDGHAETFKPGDSFVIPKGLKFTRHMPETMRKYHVIFDAKAAGV
jgi:uncharacterized cupin superfamily protein